MMLSLVLAHTEMPRDGDGRGQAGQETPALGQLDGSDCRLLGAWSLNISEPHFLFGKIKKLPE